jgi:asparagine synthase (glutamine-hydrolysing)
MCGIAGWVRLGGENIQAMNAVGELFVEALAHRGPDGQGIKLFQGKESQAMLVHRRLSILGLGEAGSQPMVSADGRYTLTFNGEIYNYIELAEQFGLACTSGTDTEVLLQLWERMGQAVLPLLDGFFAFAVWDDIEKKLVLARDRTGVKPLYYFMQEGVGLWFASEDYALWSALKKTGIELLLNHKSIIEHLSESNSDVSTLFKGMDSLAAGCVLEWSEKGLEYLGKWETGNYIRLDDDQAWVDRMGLKHTPEKYSDLLREQMKFGMKRRLRSDVPLGFAVSGGIDSAALVSMAREILGKEAHLHCFSVVSPGSLADESEYQRAVVEKVGGIWHTIDVMDLDAFDLEKYIAATHRIPVAWNNLAHFALCQKVQEAGVKVLFNGQGADEMFGGYPHYYKAAFWSERGRLWPVKDRWPIGFWEAGQQWLKYVGGWFLGKPYEDCVDRLMREDYYGQRLNQLLRFEDRNGMAWGLESRNPFADDVVMADAWLNAWGDETWNMEGSLSSKLVDGYSKGYLRQAMKGLIPESVLWRTDKKGFTVPSGRLTLNVLEHWKKWILSDRLDGFVRRGQRLSALARAQKLAQQYAENSLDKSKSYMLSPKNEALLSQIFRWAAVACFLEMYRFKEN